MSLSAARLTVSLSGRRIVDDVSLDVRSGEVVGLLGANGAGKSTLMRALAGLLPATGTVRLTGRDLASLALADRARALAFLPQARVLAWPVSVQTLVALGRHPWRGHATPAEDEAGCRSAMEAVDVLALGGRPVNQLSGGEQARVLLARALAQTTPVLIADEPCAGLDPAHQMTAMQALRRRAAEGAAVLVSLHDIGLAARWCDRVILMQDGNVAASGPPAETLTPDALRRVFGISVHLSHDDCGMILVPTGLSRDP